MRAIATYALLKYESLPAGGEGDASLMGMGCYISRMLLLKSAGR